MPQSSEGSSPRHRIPPRPTDDGSESGVRAKRRRQGGVARLLRESEARYRALAYATGAIVWAAAADGASGDGAWSGFTGQTSEQARGWGWLDAVHPTEGARARDEWTAAIATRLPFTLYFRARRADGLYRLMQCRGVPVFEEDGAGGEGEGDGEGAGGNGERVREWVVVATDVTEQVEREHVLAERTHAVEVARQDQAELLEGLTDGFLAMDEEGRLTYVNAEIERVVGQSRDELLGRNVWEAFPAAVGLPFHGEYKRVMATRAPALFEAYYPPLGLWLEAHLYPLPGGVVAYFTDITERKQAEEQRARALAEEREARRAADAAREEAATGQARFSRLMESNVVGMAVTDSVRILEANDAFLAMVGYTREELAAGGLAWWDITPPEDRERDRRALAQTLMREDAGPLRVAPIEKEYLRRDGSRVPTLLGIVEVEHEPLSILCFLVDLSVRKRLERELTERAAELEILIEAMADGVIVYDASDRIVRMNSCARELLGVEDGEAEEYALLPPERRLARYTMRSAQGRALTLSDWPERRVLRGEVLSGPQAVDVRLRLPDGRERALNITGSPLRDAEGRPSGAVLVLRDVTERRELEHQRTDILRTVAHDLANPVAAMKLYVQMQERRVQKGLATKAPDEEALGWLSHTLGRTERLLQDLRTAASIEAGALHLALGRVELCTLCRHEADLQREATGRDVALDLPEPPVEVEADGERIGQVLGNLLANALKYSPHESTVRLALRAEERSVRVSVTDEGPGIPSRELARIWEQFHRVEGIQAQQGFGQGLGLGLFISRSIIERHGSEIGVESKPGAGSTFWFTLARPLEG